MRRLLITGGAGFIGANFTHYWLQHHGNDRVVVLDALTYAGNLSSLDSLREHSAFRFVQGDIRDQALVEALLKEERLDTIVHFAAESHVDRSILGPDSFIETNIIGTHSLLKAARTCWLDADDAPADPRFHHVSTDEVYGSLKFNSPPFTETSVYAPNSPYAASKASSDHLVRAYHHTYGLPVTTSNCSNNYGPYQFPEKLIPLVIVNALHGKPLPIYGKGENIRDWLYVDDHNRGIDAILEHGKPGATYNIGGNNEHANIDIVRTLCQSIDRAFDQNGQLAQRFPDAPAANDTPTDQLITFVADRPGHDLRYAIDATKIKSELEYTPKVPFETGIAQTLNWYLNNEAWWRGILDGSYRHWITQNYGTR